MNIYKDLLSKKKKIGVVGLGYVGLPFALEFAKKYKVIGFDINKERINMMKSNIDPCKEFDASVFQNKDIVFTYSKEDLKDVSVYVIAVPTPINNHAQPDLSFLLKATEIVGDVLKKGDYVIYESTVYPGCTEEDCLPILETKSGLKCYKDFKIGYSPERINPGDKVHTLVNTVKIVSGCDQEALDQIALIYESIIKAGVHKASCIKVAEAAKIIENTQRDVNIALMNELSIIFSRIGINTHDVIDAAGTKWNFLKFYPGLVGGHCIGVDPYYLDYKARALKYHTQMISGGRFVNDSMGGYFAKKIVKLMIASDKTINKSRALIMGITFKENVADTRNSKVVDIIRELEDYGVEVDIVDPYADAKEVKKEYNIKMLDAPDGKYDAVIVAVSHDKYTFLDEDYFLSITTDKAILGDVKGLYRNKIKELKYFSL